MNGPVNIDTARLEGLHQHAQRGYFSLQNLEQQAPVNDIAMGTGWPDLDEIWKVYPGQFTIVTGIPGHGKSTFLLNVVANLARKNSLRSFLYVPENEGHLRDKLANIWGNRPGWDEFATDQCFVQSAVPDDYSDEPQDLSWVLNRAVTAIKKDGVNLLMIDPWNELEFAKRPEMPMTEYIRLCLMYLKQFCRAYNVAVILVAHPTKAVAENGGRTPLLSDIEGSMSWYNKCDNGLVVVRDFDTKLTRVISAKVREQGSGAIGTCFFHVDSRTGMFTPAHVSTS